MVFLAFKAKAVEQGRNLGSYSKGRLDKGRCDDDTLLIEVIQKGPACHTGSKTCFFKEIKSEVK